MLQQTPALAPGTPGLAGAGGHGAGSRAGHGAVSASVGPGGSVRCRGGQCAVVLLNIAALRMRCAWRAGESQGVCAADFSGPGLGHCAHRGFVGQRRWWLAYWPAAAGWGCAFGTRRVWAVRWWPVVGCRRLLPAPASVANPPAWVRRRAACPRWLMVWRAGYIVTATFCRQDCARCLPAGLVWPDLFWPLFGILGVAWGRPVHPSAPVAWDRRWLPVVSVGGDDWRLRGPAWWFALGSCRARYPPHHVLLLVCKRRAV